MFWGVLSGLLACVAAVVAMVAALPRTCNPELPWFQGKLFYEIFPASFQDTNGDGMGDIKGIVSRIDYIKSLGVQVVRLNSILKSPHYPERYNHVNSLTEIDKNVGNMKDFSLLVRTLHEKNISLVLDLPIYPFITELEPFDLKSAEKQIRENLTGLSENVHWKISEKKEKSVSNALKYWISLEVDGFYLKGLENMVGDPHFVEAVREWKRVIGSDRVLIVNYETVQNLITLGLNNVLYSIDLVDVLLDVSNGTSHIKQQIDNVIRSSLFTKPGLPWIHWTVGSADSKRLSVKLPQNNTLSAILLNMMLPGTPSIFYGDEISLDEISEPEEDYPESQHVYNLMPMIWPDKERQFTSGKVLPWITGDTSSPEISPFWHVNVIRLLAHLRPQASSIYLNSVWKDGTILPNTQVRYKKSIIVVHRWYPRKSAYVFVANLGTETIVTDLSSWFYGGIVVVGSDMSLVGKAVIFKAITLEPAEVIIIKLEK